MAQLRKADVQQAGSHWVAVITPDAGTVKNKKARDVPLHPQLIEIGFIDFVKASASGYLFINAANRAEANRRIGAIKNRVAEFTRQHVDDSRIRPNHAWRHRMVTLCRRHGVDQELRRMITGHSGEGTDEEVYGDPDGLFREICKLPHYPI